MRWAACHLIATCASVLVSSLVVAAWECTIQVAGSSSDSFTFNENTLRCQPGLDEDGNLTVTLHPQLQAAELSGCYCMSDFESRCCLASTFNRIPAGSCSLSLLLLT